MSNDVKDHLLTYYPYYLAVLFFVFIVISIILTKKKMRKIRLRELWNSRDKDVVTLHMFNRAMTAPNASPFPIKLELYLKIMDIK